MTKANAQSFLSTLEGLNFLIHITDEYGTWNDSLGSYDLPLSEAIDLAIEELQYAH